MSTRQITRITKKVAPNPMEIENALKRARDSEENVPVKKSKSLLDLISSSEEEKEANALAVSSSSPSWDGAASPVYDPRSPKYSVHSQEEESDEAEDFIDSFFDQKGVPFGLDRKNDGFLLDPRATDTCEKMRRAAKINEQMSRFSRHIRTFKNGDIVTKHTRPFGQKCALYGNAFRINNKFYTGRSDLAFVIIVGVEEPHREIILDAPFFSGWANSKCRQEYNDFC